MGGHSAGSDLPCPCRSQVPPRKTLVGVMINFPSPHDLIKPILQVKDVRLRDYVQSNAKSSAHSTGSVPPLEHISVVPWWGEVSIPTRLN